MKKRKKQPLTFDKILLQPDFISFIEKNRNKDVDSSGKQAVINDDVFQHELEKASSIYHILTSHRKITHSGNIIEQHTYRLLARINADEKSRKRDTLLLFSKIAASVIMIVVFSVFLLKHDKFILSDKNEPKMELIVPSGEKSQLILADGTKIWVNSESKLVYPVRFNGRERKVLLEGEAYFDVSKVKKSQFVVYTQDFKVKVLGTKFNVKSYPKDRTIETTVVEGLVRIEDGEEKIRFSPVLLKSAERMIFRKDYSNNSELNVNRSNSREKIQKETPDTGKEIMISNVNTENITCWKDQLLVFDNETLEDIAIKMSRWYKVQIDILDSDLKTQRYTGKFVNNESLKQVLEAINLTTPIKYGINQNNVQISLKSK
jgi:transmembrane sensor